MDAATGLIIITIVFYIFCVVAGLWITWAVIRGAVLSALRKHAAEQRAEGQRPYMG